jgi:hypothetical protein
MKLELTNAWMRNTTLPFEPVNIPGGTINGTLVKKSGADLAGCYGISKNGRFAMIAEDDNLGAFRFYLELEEGVSARNIGILVDGESDDATGITETENGKLKTENYYDLSGRRVQNAQKGVFIVNGKKVVK